MTNDLKNFLEGEYKSFGTDFGEPIGFKEGNYFCCGGDYCEGHSGDMEKIKNHDEKLINFVLQLVEKEAKQTKTKSFSDQVSTIINNLRV